MAQKESIPFSLVASCRTRVVCGSTHNVCSKTGSSITHTHGRYLGLLCGLPIHNLRSQTISPKTGKALIEAAICQPRTDIRAHGYMKVRLVSPLTHTPALFAELPPICMMEILAISPHNVLSGPPFPGPGLVFPTTPSASVKWWPPKGWSVWCCAAPYSATRGGVSVLPDKISC